MRDKTAFGHEIYLAEKNKGISVLSLARCFKECMICDITIISVCEAFLIFSNSAKIGHDSTKGVFVSCCDILDERGYYVSNS